MSKHKKVLQLSVDFGIQPLCSSNPPLCSNGFSTASRSINPSAISFEATRIRLKRAYKVPNRDKQRLFALRKTSCSMHVLYATAGRHFIQMYKSSRLHGLAGHSGPKPCNYLTPVESMYGSEGRYNCRIPAAQCVVMYMNEVAICDFPQLHG